MKTFKLLFIVTFLSFYIFVETASSQSLSVFDFDTTAFPVLKAKFYAFDVNGTQVTNLSPSDFQVTENGIPRKVLSTSCPAPKPTILLSTVLVMDQSGSMGDDHKLQSMYDAATAWIQAMPGKSECAITSFDDKNYLIQDFTTDKTVLIQKVNTITANSGTDYNKALIDCNGFL